MNYGMSYEQYWFGDPWITRAYAQAYLLKRRVENENMWLQGIYYVKALQFALDGEFSKNSKTKYYDKPLDIFPKTEAEKEQEIREERQRLIDFLSQWKKSADKKQGVDKNGEP